MAPVFPASDAGWVAWMAAGMRIIQAWGERAELTINGVPE